MNGAEQQKLGKELPLHMNRNQNGNNYSLDLQLDLILKLNRHIKDYYCSRYSFWSFIEAEFSISLGKSHLVKARSRELLFQLLVLAWLPIM